MSVQRQKILLSEQKGKCQQLGQDLILLHCPLFTNKRAFFYNSVAHESYACMHPHTMWQSGWALSGTLGVAA